MAHAPSEASESGSLTTSFPNRCGCHLEIWSLLQCFDRLKRYYEGLKKQKQDERRSARKQKSYDSRESSMRA
jgi:hypothetical protein